MAKRKQVNTCSALQSRKWQVLQHIRQPFIAHVDGQLDRAAATELP